MKKLTLLPALVTSAFVCAAPVGNPSAPQLIEEGFFISRNSWVDVRAGYEGDFISDARMKQCIEGSGRVDTYSQDTNSGTFTINILDRVDLYGVFGSSRTCADWRFTTSEGDVNRVQMETFYHFSWGAGARALLFEWGNTSIGAGGRYSQCFNRPVWLTVNGVSSSVSGSHLQWHEWQVDLDVSYRIDLLTPYVGLKYSSARAKLNGIHAAIAGNGTGTDHFKNRTPVGIFVGCSLSNGKYFMLNVEGRLVDEEAVTISGDLRF